MVHLFLAFTWLVLGVFFLVMGWVDPQGKVGQMGQVGGVVALLLCVYNLVRWWAVRSYAANRQILRDAEARRRQEDQRRPERAPDPNFMFEDRPPS